MCSGHIQHTVYQILYLNMQRKSRYCTKLLIIMTAPALPPLFKIHIRLCKSLTNV